MTSTESLLEKCEKKILRARELGERYKFAQEPLAFYEQIVLFQKSFLHKLQEPSVAAAILPATIDQVFRSELNFDEALASYAEFLNVVKRIAPRPLAHEAAELLRAEPSSQMALLRKYWAEGGKERDGDRSNRNALNEFLARGFLQPFAQLRAAQYDAHQNESAQNLCPKCDSLPLLGVLRPEGDGGKRWLVCSFCAHEWIFRRILCPACGEEHEDKLPVYVAELFPHIRVEACDTCKRHIRTIDLTKEGNAVAEADDLAAIPLTLWAQEFGYERIFANLLGA